jgi:hypothetical protein
MTTWHMRIACWITKATSTHSEYVILIAFYCKNGCTNAPQCYVYTYIVCLFNSLFTGYQARLRIERGNFQTHALTFGKSCNTCY